LISCIYKGCGILHDDKAMEIVFLGEHDEMMYLYVPVVNEGGYENFDNDDKLASSQSLQVYV
jgi:hypothetical protein